MRFLMFLVVTCLALVTAAGSQIDLAARCRCDRPARGDRKAARQERKAARRGCSTQYATPAPSYNPYDSGVQPLGAAAPTEYRWECNGRSCRRVPVTPQAAPVPVPDPAFKATVTPPKEEAKETPATEPESTPDGPAVSLNDGEIRSLFNAETAWRPDPPVITAELHSAIPQLDE